MTEPAPPPGPRAARFTLTPRDRSIRLVAALGERDDLAAAHLSADGFAVERCAPEALERTATRANAEAIVLDADLEGALAALQRVRKSAGVVSTVPVVLLGASGVVLRTSLDAVDAGGDAFLPRPVAPEDLAYRLRTLLELPGTGGASHPPATPGAPAEPHPLPPSLAPPPPGAPSSPGENLGLAQRLSPALAEVLRAAAVRAGGSEAELVLPAPDDEAIDELIPAELLEPLDAPLDGLGEELSMGAPSAQHTPPPYSAAGGSPRRGSNRGFNAVGSARPSSPTPTITPLSLGGELRLTGSLGRHGAGALLGAAWRARASGLIVLRARGDEYALALTAGHLLALRSSRAADETGALLARLGTIPREAARFAIAPLDAGARGAALLAARGYLAPDALGQALARAARELLFDLLALPELEWEMRPLESAAEIPLAPRALDALLVAGARARIEPEQASAALGGDEVLVSAMGAISAGLPLAGAERDAAEQARGQTLAALAAAHGVTVLPALLALAWLGALRLEGPGGAAAVPPALGTALAQERTRVRALGEAAIAGDFFALLGVSEWTSRTGALEALDARRAELAGLRARHPDASGLVTVSHALDEIGRLLDDASAWESFVAALRARTDE